MVKTIANPTTSQVVGRISELHRRLEEAGLSFDDLQLPIDDPEMRKRLVRFWKAGAHEASTDQKLARAIFGLSFIGPKDVAELLKVQFSAKQLTQLEPIPFTEATLQEVRNTHVLVAGFPLSIDEIRRKVPHLFCTSEGGWYANEAFARKKVRLAWHLVRRDIVPGSTNRPFTKDEKGPGQLELLGENEFVPRASEMVYAAILGAMAAGSRIPENVYGRTEDIDSFGNRVIVGFYSGRLSIFRYWVDGRRSDFGLAAARKS